MTRERDSERYAVGLRQPVVVRPNEWMAVQGHLYAVSEHVEDQLDGGPSLRDYDTSVRALSFEGDWRKVESGRLRIVSAGVYQGLDYLGARSDADYDLDFLRLRLSGLQSDTLAGNWQGVASGALYWSDDRLPDSERAGFGGLHFGRGYPRDQADGDKGWGVAYELNYSLRGNGLALVQPMRQWMWRRPGITGGLWTMPTWLQRHLAYGWGMGATSTLRWRWRSLWRMWRWIAWTVAPG